MVDMIEGLVAAPLAGFREDGSLNLDVVPRYAEMLPADGVAGAFVNGTTGEGMCLTLKERCDLAKRWVDAAPAGFKVIIHVGYTCQADSQLMAAHAQEIGADGIGEIGPAWVIPSTVADLADYCAATASAAPKLPYYYYHMPSLSQVLFPMTGFLEAASEAIPNLAGIKFTYEDLDDYAACLGFGDGRYNIMFGRDEILIEGLKLGATAAVGSTYNVFAPLYNALIAAFRSGDVAEAERLQAISANACIVLNGTGSGRSALKHLLKASGIDLGGVRCPQVNLSDEVLRDVDDRLRETGVLDYVTNC